MTNKRALHDVAERLDLADQWDLTKQLALQRLDDTLTVSQVPGTTKVIIEYVSENASLAEEITAAVAASHQSWRCEMNEKRSNAALATLERQLSEQAIEVEAIRLQMLEEAESPHLKDLTFFRKPLDGVARLAQDEEARETVNRLSHQISRLSDLEGKELVEEIHRLGVSSRFVGKEPNTGDQNQEGRMLTVEEALEVKKSLPTKLEMAQRTHTLTWQHTKEMSEASQKQIDKLRKQSVEHSATRKTLEQMSEMMKAAAESDRN